MHSLPFPIESTKFHDPQGSHISLSTSDILCSITRFNLPSQSIIALARPDAVKAVFLVTDGYSNGGDPRPAAEFLQARGVRIFTFGIRNGNVKVRLRCGCSGTVTQPFYLPYLLNETSI